ncbi:uncharacterized protein LOC141535587 [Cotesia typhae]|uniref:uncharacterized protein LOC141535587 n=1 Tax=Cotesia typhae TaxID=2053667 RepID=UPI003D6887E3
MSLYNGLEISKNLSEEIKNSKDLSDEIIISVTDGDFINNLIPKQDSLSHDNNNLCTETKSVDSKKILKQKLSGEGKILDKDQDGLCLNEDKLQTELKSAFTAFTKRSLDLPRFKCISCQKLVFTKDVIELSKLCQPISNEIWNNLINFINEQDKTMNSDFICKYCLQKIRSGSMPPTCLLNNMYVGKIPNEIFALNEYEKVLIQRAKAFQVVQRLGTVAKKNLPHTMRIQKLKGQTFHLPLPIEETLKKICSTTDPLNKHHELYIVMRSIPTKSNVIWEKMVSLENVFRVLTWLKRNNTLYSEIELPQCPQNLRECEKNDNDNTPISMEQEKNDIVSKEEILDDNQNVEELSNKSEDRENKGLSGDSITKEHSYTKMSSVRDKSINSSDHTYSKISLSTKDKETTDKIDIQESKSETPQHQAMITQVLNPDSSQYAQYTIYPLHDKRKNDTSTNMYQMLKINEKALNNRIKTLDLQCFPDLYPYGKNGQCEERNVPLTAFEYIKPRLKSADSRFRLNQQYLFFLLNDANIRQLGAGVYHTLNITNAREKYTAKSYLKHLKDGQLEANLTTLFARLRNSEQFWKINAPHFDKLSASEVIAADPVSVSRFIDNKFQAVLEFIKSDSQPLGPLSHYFWRREYQGRGIQHFHLILWVEGAPIMGINTNEEVVEFIMKYVTFTAYEQKKPKSGKVSKACRFGFPRPVSENFVLRDTATSIAGRRNLKSKSRLYDLPRNENEVNINDYNPSVLSVWEGNMDIQFIGEKSTILTQYITKYATKREITKSSETINEINSTKTLPQLLWKIAFRSLTHREVGALEAADTLLGISLHGTDSETIIKWLDVRMIRNRKLKTKAEIEELEHNDPESTEIFCPSLIDDYYPNRPKDLENLCLYNFAKWSDITKTEPKNNLNEYYEIRPGLFLKKRLRGYLINHFRYNIANRPEDYFYSLLLLFQPWRNTDELKNGFETYTESFTHQQYMLQQANDYHEYNEEIEKELNQETVVTAPTSIAAFNINGLTIHRVFQLPVEHGFTPSYTQLSDNVLKALRDQLQNTMLFIIDEISMVSNITLIYIHLRLVEIFDVDDWFGGKHVVVFGDLLQLPPVHENPSYVTLSSQDAEKYVGSMCSVNLWTDLFSYEELRINMRQKTDNIYGQLLSRVRVASMTNDDIKLLEQRKITIEPSLSYNEKLHEICNYIDKLPSDSVCLVPTCKQCDLINSVMTSKIFSEEIILTARDHIDCNKSLIKKVSETLNKIEDNASQSAGLAKTITIKIGAKVMLRRNIDVTLGLVNGAIGTVKSVSKSIDGSEIKAINIDFGADTEYAIEKIKVKFQLFERAFVVREQFPLCLSYAVTIHKSQGLSLKNAIIEAGNTIFNVGQIYVGLSRIAELRGLHLINFDPHSVKASSLAIKEYNRLRKIYRSDLPTIPIPNTRWQKVWDMIWAVEEHSIQIEPKNAKKASLSL